MPAASRRRCRCVAAAVRVGPRCSVSRRVVRQPRWGGFESRDSLSRRRECSARRLLERVRKSCETGKIIVTSRRASRDFRINWRRAVHPAPALAVAAAWNGPAPQRTGFSHPPSAAALAGQGVGKSVLHRVSLLDRATRGHTSCSPGGGCSRSGPSDAPLAVSCSREGRAEPPESPRPGYAAPAAKRSSSSTTNSVTSRWSRISWSREARSTSGRGGFRSSALTWRSAALASVKL
jgi:hypothetical protein